MRTGLILALFAVALSIISPMSLCIAAPSEGTSIVTLDMCNAGPLISLSHEGVCICDQAVTLHVQETMAALDGETDPFRQFLLALSIDRPPRA